MHLRKQYAGSLGEIDSDMLSHKSSSNEVTNGLVKTTYLNSKASKAREQIETKVFRHLSVLGEEGSGKMSFIRLLCQGNEKENQDFIVVTLEETFDSKNLVGTYVCNEIGGQDHSN